MWCWNVNKGVHKVLIGLMQKWGGVGVQSNTPELIEVDWCMSWGVPVVFIWADTGTVLQGCYQGWWWNVTRDDAEIIFRMKLGCELECYLGGCWQYIWGDAGVLSDSGVLSEVLLVSYLEWCSGVTWGHFERLSRWMLVIYQSWCWSVFWFWCVIWGVMLVSPIGWCFVVIWGVPEMVSGWMLVIYLRWC